MSKTSIRGLRIGQGYDIHPLVTHKKLMIGGIEIPSQKGSDGHSDGDVLIHAVCDALLGAANLGDLEMLFPPSRKELKNKDSSYFLIKISELIQSHHYSIINIDCSIILETPKLETFKKKIARNLAFLLKITPNQVSVKAKTKEQFDSVGKENALEAFCSVLITKIR